MPATIHGERTLTELDFVRLGKLADRQLPPALSELLDAADVLPSREIPSDLVTMNSQVEIEDPATRRRQKITLCYPGDAQPGAGFVSVMSPIGIGLLGVKTGTTACWRMPNGTEGSAHVVAVLFQPEASGDYTR
ncbi:MULTISPECIES: GreA/GreB family elongation factor [unclassified Variovorax]|jgi:regulator of nucleoside diphosphate kinase|uniref:GreA/GreB family elongation factor n=1 Tax=unclassified Variovorax TaxID=663243 RepID=UPI000F7F1740|nr:MULTISPECIES: GreA/GreB family elongation factor [unclassified Variovorax]RSZ36991.1 transcription elongation factor GreAB [Variovorax sp. 553]RSZ37804.1 transcription elongation factor GreAB [Variovorax sp. 679]